MASIKMRKNKDGTTVIKATICVGRDVLDKQVWRSKTFPCPEGLRKRELTAAINAIVYPWEQEEKKKFEESHHVKEITLDKDKVTLEQFIKERWLPLHSAKGKGKAVTTEAFYTSMSQDIIQRLGKLRVHAIDSEVVEQYELYLRTEVKTKQGKPYSETTIRRHLETLKNIARLAVRKHYLEEDPFADSEITNKTDKTQTVDALTAAEFWSFLEAIETDRVKSDGSLFWTAYFWLSATGGLRRGEMIGLQWGDYNEDNSRIVIRRNVTIDTKNKEIHIGETKTSKVRTVFLGDEASRILKQFREEQKARYGKLKDQDFIFCKDGQPQAPIYPTTPTKWLNRLEERHNLRKLSPHDLRHGAGTFVKKAGGDDKDAQTLLGHSDLSTTTAYYLSVDEDLLRRTTTGIEKYLAHAKENKTNK